MGAGFCSVPILLKRFTAEKRALPCDPVYWEATALPLSYTRADPSHNTAPGTPKALATT